MVDLGLAVFFLVMSISYLILARQYAFGTVHAPSAGFIPTLVGMGATVLAVINLVGTLMRYIGNRMLLKEDILTQAQIRRVLWYSLGLILYVILLKVVGFLPATFVATVYLIRVAGGKDWRIVIIVAIGISAGFYYIFQYLFGLMLP